MERSSDTSGKGQSTASEAARKVAGERWPAPDAQAGTERPEISAQDVRKECLQDQIIVGLGGASRGRSSNHGGGQEVSFEDKKITGQLDLTGALLDRPVRFTDCDFTHPIVLTGARAAGIHLERCKILSLRGDRLSVDGDLLLEEVQSNGEISICGARLTGHLRCTGSKFSHPSGKAFNAKGTMVEGSALFDGDFSSEGEFILASARIRGTVDMTGGSFSNTPGFALMAEGIRVDTGMLLSAKFTGSVILTEAHVSGKIKCSGGNFVASPGEMAINAVLVEADGICFDAGFAAAGEVHLDGSTVTGRLLCNGGKFCNPGGIALSANGLDCQDVRLGYDFNATGEVKLIGAKISREFNCTNGTFDNEGNVALQADGLICEGKAYLNEKFHAMGEVRLCNARIATELTCSNGTFENREGAALNVGGLTCDGNVYLNDNFTAIGKVELIDATISRELNCGNGKFGELIAQRLVVGTKFVWQPRETPKEVNLAGATIGLLRDHFPKSWPKGETRVAGLTIGNLGDESQAKARQRIEWHKDEGYAPGIYQQLTRIYREKGLDREANEIAIIGQRIRRRGGGKGGGMLWPSKVMKTWLGEHVHHRRRRKDGRMPWPSRLWSWFLEYMVGYGYRIEKPLIVALVWGLVGTLFFYLAQRNHIMVPVSDGHNATIDANSCPSKSDYPCFMPVTYSFELLFPVVNLRQVNFWLPSAATSWGKLLLLDVWLSIAAGWILGIAVAAGIGHLFSQRK